jgi:hypothetical protein
MQDQRGNREAPEVEPFDQDTAVDPTEAVEQAEPYFPPTDPVVRQPGHGEVKVAGGFGTGELREGHVHAETEVAYSDEGLEDAVRAELALDASTTHLRLVVSAKDGVVRLSGEVADASDSENALAVAGRVPGVVEVVDDLRSA